jgi:hypothetical protein
MPALAPHERDIRPADSATTGVPVPVVECATGHPWEGEAPAEPCSWRMSIGRSGSAGASPSLIMDHAQA